MKEIIIGLVIILIFLIVLFAVKNIDSDSIKCNQNDTTRINYGDKWGSQDNFVESCFTGTWTSEEKLVKRLLDYSKGIQDTVDSVFIQLAPCTNPPKTMRITNSLNNSLTLVAVECLPR